MTGTTEPGVAKRRLCSQLRQLRKAAGMSQEMAAKELEWSVSKLSRIEKGQNGLRGMDAKNMCEVYGRLDMAESLAALARAANNKSWWHTYSDVIPEGFDVYIGLEPVASSFRWYETQLVPGILQTEAYARTLIREDHPDDSDVEIDRRVQFRLTRQSLLTREEDPQQWHVVLDEGILNRPIGGQRVMLAQFERLLELSELPNVTVGVIPFGIGTNPGVTAGPFVLLDFPLGGDGQPTEPTTVYVEGFTGALCVDQNDVVERYRTAFEGIQQVALSEEDSRASIAQAIKEMKKR